MSQQQLQTSFKNRQKQLVSKAQQTFLNCMAINVQLIPITKSLAPCGSNCKYCTSPFAKCFVLNNTVKVYNETQPITDKLEMKIFPDLTRWFNEQTFRTVKDQYRPSFCSVQLMHYTGSYLMCHSCHFSTDRCISSRASSSSCEK